MTSHELCSWFCRGCLVNTERISVIGRMLGSLQVLRDRLGFPGVRDPESGLCHLDATVPSQELPGLWFSPRQLVYYRGNWYLDAWCYQKNVLRSLLWTPYSSSSRWMNRPRMLKMNCWMHVLQRVMESLQASRLPGPLWFSVQGKPAGCCRAMAHGPGEPVSGG